MEERITGVMVYYYFVCMRKLWYFCHGINMESGNEDVLIGKILDDNSYMRDEKHISIDNTINIDFIKEHKVLHEIKKSRSIEEAGIWQVKYYLYYLEGQGIQGLKAQIDYPLLKQKLEIELTDEDRRRLKEVIEEIKKVKIMDTPPKFLNKRICKKCAYFDLCCI